MVSVFPPLSFWIQAANLFFTLSGVHGDILVIRFFLFLAYLMLFVNAALGSPLWPNPTNPGTLAVDSLTWSILGLYVHGSSLFCLLLDERAVDLTEDEAALWRLFYRTGGLSACLFKKIVAPYLEVVEFLPGEDIPTDDFFYILYTGEATLSVDTPKISRHVHSGEMFDLYYLGMFTDTSVFATGKIYCKSVSHCKTFRFSKDDMQRIAHHRFAKGVWQSLLINNLSYVVEAYMDKAVNREKSDMNIVCDSIFSPLHDWEQPKTELAGSGQALKKPFQHLLTGIRKSFAAPWPFAGHPTGIRQTLLPPPAHQSLSSTSSIQSQPRFHGNSERPALFDGAQSRPRFRWSWTATRSARSSTDEGGEQEEDPEVEMASP